MEKNRDILSVEEQLGKRIAYLRKQAKKSQLDLSLDANVATSYICDLEKGRRNPSVEVLARIAAALNVSLETLFKGVGPIKFF